MQKMSDLVPQNADQFRAMTRPVVSEQRQPNEAQRAALDAMRKTVDAVFNTLKAFYTNHSTSMKTPEIEAEIKKQWAHELIRGNVNPEMLRVGVNRAKRYATEDKFTKWPVVAEFIIWCYGLLSADDAYREAVDNSHDIAAWRPSHPAVYLAGKTVSWHRLRRSDTDAGQRAYKREYAKLCDAVIRGEQLAVSKPELIEKKPLTPSERAELTQLGRSRVGDLKALLGGG
jgi:hypothetical protein